MSHSQLPIHLSHFHIRRSKWSGKISQTFNPERSLQQERSSLDHISVDPNGFNPRSHERGIDGSTTSETSLTKYSEAASRQAATSFSQTQPESRIQINFKNLIKAIITKKIQDPLLPQNTKDDEKKSSKYKNIESKKSFKKNLQNSITKKNQQNPTKTKKLAARGGSPQPHFINQQGRKD